MNALSGIEATSVGLGFAVAWKSTALLAAVLIAVRAFTQRRASLAAAIANAGLLGLLLLPLWVVALPPLVIACLPSRDSGPAIEAVPAIASTPAVDSQRLTTELPLQGAESPIDKAGGEVSLDLVDTPGTLQPSRHDVVRNSDLPDGIGIGRRSLLLMIGAYVLVALALLIRLAGGLAAVARLRRRAVAVDDPEWCSCLERCRGRLGIHRVVRLAWSADVNVPVVVGWRRPSILLPASAASLGPSGHADAILLHELAHIHRGDYPWNVLQRLTVALYWVNPLSWLLAKASSEARERACDDLCVHEMGGPAAYRATLLAVASGMARRPGPALGLAMARRPMLARRLAGIDASRGSSRCLPCWPARIAVAAIGLVAFGLVGAARLTPARGQSTANGPNAIDAGPRSRSEKAPAGNVFRLRVVAADTRRPIPRANVRIWIALRDEWRTTDDLGRLDILHSTGPDDTSFGVDVWGDGYAMQRRHWGDRVGQPVPAEDEVGLHPGESLGGVVQDEARRPIADAVVYLWSHNYNKKESHELLYDLRATTGADGRWRTSGAPETTGEILGFRIDHPDYLSDRDYTAGRAKPTIADLRAGKAVSVMTKGVPIEGRVLDPDGKPVAGATVFSSPRPDSLGSGVREFAVTSDEAGRFRTGQVRSAEYYLVAKAGGHAPGETSVKVGKAVPYVEVRLGRPRPLAGKVVDTAGKPVEGAFVNVDTWRRYRFLGVFLYTDREGRFRWDDAPDDPLIINVDSRGYVGVSHQRVEPSEKDVAFTLSPSLHVSGKVRDGETKKRVERAAIEYGAVDPKTGEVAAWNAMPTVGAGVIVYQGNLNVNLPVTADAYKFRILADGYEPFVSRAIRRDELAVYDYEIDLQPAERGGMPSGKVLRPDGTPLVGARVYRGVLNEGSVGVRDGVVQTRHDSGREVRTGPDGAFSVPAQAKPWVALILGDDCFAYASKGDLEANPSVRARLYARVEGRYMIGSRPGAGLPVELNGSLQDRSTMYCTISTSERATTDAEGRFRFEKVIPIGDLHVARRDAGNGPGRIWSIGTPVRVEPGATATVTLGGAGRPVVGRVEPPVGWAAAIDFTENARAGIESNRPWTPYPLALFRGKTSLQGGEWSEWSQSWRESPEGRDYRDRRVAASVGLAPDGSFRLDDVPPGEYRLSVHVNERSPLGETGPFARLVQVFTVPPVPGGRSDEPLDLGALRLRPRTVLRPGDPAPAFEVTTVDGRKLAVPGDFKGKVLLVDFGTLWDQQSRLQIPRLNEVYKRFGDDAKFAILSLTLDADTTDVRGYIADKGEPWPQAIVGHPSNPIASAYGIHDWNVHGAILIGPDGRLVASGLYYGKIGTAVGEALGRN